MNPSFKDRDKNLTIVDVAQILGVSKSTVSAAFTGNGTIAAGRREEVRRAAIELGYRPNPNAQKLVQQHQDNSIALLTSYLDLDVRTQKLHLIQRNLSERGYTASIHALGTLLTSASAETEVVIQNLRRLRPLAIVCNQWELNQTSRDELLRFCEEGGSLVYYDVPLDLDCDQVIFDREENTYTAMRHLLELGHREIGFFMPPGDKWRIEGVRRALQEFGALLRDEWLKAPREGRYEDAGGHLAEYFCAQHRRPTAMCIINDNVTIGFVAQLQRRGLRVPEDVSVISHHDTAAALWGSNVQLSSVTQPIEIIAEKVVELLLERLENKYQGAPRTVTVRGELVARESTAKLKS
jgi:DNA-binding LacI/PurR family transcriptional regulator